MMTKAQRGGKPLSPKPELKSRKVKGEKQPESEDAAAEQVRQSPSPSRMHDSQQELQLGVKELEAQLVRQQHPNTEPEAPTDPNRSG